MGRPARYSREALVAAAVELAAEGGAGAVTMQGLAEATGASSGSVYHRFDSRARLLGAVWLEALSQFQRDWWAQAEHEADPGELALIAVLWARSHRAAAKLLLLHRVSEFLGGETPAELRQQAAELQQLTQQHWEQLAKRLLGEASAEAVERTVFAFATVPLAALRRHLAEDTPLPERTELLIRETALALMRRRTS